MASASLTAAVDGLEFRNTVVCFYESCSKRSGRIYPKMLRNWTAGGRIVPLCSMAHNVLHRTVTGDPKPYQISTSHIERQNLTIRMQLRRFTRLMNAFSKRLDNLKASLSLHFAWYNFCWVHPTLRVTPAMASDITDEIWAFNRLVN
ncbi:MAG: hypothetical protein ACRD59_03020 [Candidatus Acidiferrales bacterium]